MKILFTVPGEPQGKGRPRFNGKSGTTYTPQKTAEYEQLVVLAYRSKCGNTKFPPHAALDMRIRAYFAIPASDSNKQRAQKTQGAIRPTKKPDWDNIGKIIADSLNGVAYRDDSQIVDAQVRKFFGSEPRVEVTIEDVT